MAPGLWGHAYSLCAGGEQRFDVKECHGVVRDSVVPVNEQSGACSLAVCVIQTLERGGPRHPLQLARKVGQV